MPNPEFGQSQPEQPEAKKEGNIFSRLAGMFDRETREEAKADPKDVTKLQEKRDDEALATAEMRDSHESAIQAEASPDGVVRESVDELAARREAQASVDKARAQVEAAAQNQASPAEVSERKEAA